MTLDAQVLFDVLIAIVATLLGWLASSSRREIEEMKRNHAAVAEKVQTLEVTMPKEYASKAALERALDEVKDTLKTIQEDVKKLLVAKSEPKE